jgi:flavin-dependent dehydrogenase
LLEGVAQEIWSGIEARTAAESCGKPEFCFPVTRSHMGCLPEGQWAKRPEETNSISSPRTAQQRVAVIGGSAAGLFTASLLAQRGLSVRVFERIEALEPAERTLIVTHRMRAILGRAAEPSIVNQIRRFELFTDGRAATITLKKPDFIIERRRLIQALADQAQKAGARLELGHRFHTLHANESGLTVEVERCADRGREELRAEAVVGGDGAASRVARAAGWAPLETVPLMQAIVPLPADMAPDTVRVWFVPRDTPYFYWLIPESPARGALGVIGETGPETRTRLEQFLEKRKLEPLEFQGARIPVYKRWVPVRRQLGNGSVYLVGDAAAQVKVSTVGGVVTGFRGALGVAEAILNGGSSRELRKLRRELDFHRLLRQSLHCFQQADYSRLVDLLNDPVKKSLGESTRDDAWRLMLRVCLRQPRLVLLGLRGLLMRSKSIDKPGE